MSDNNQWDSDFGNKGWDSDSQPKKKWSGNSTNQWSNKNSQWKSKSSWKPGQPYTPKPLKKPMTIRLPYTFYSNSGCPDTITKDVNGLTKFLDRRGFTLRVTDVTESPSKEAIEGIDKKETYLPWKDFNDQTADFYTKLHGKDLTKLIYPNFDSVKPGAQSIMARTAHMIMGEWANEASKCLILWTSDGAEHVNDKTEDTGYAFLYLLFCNVYNIPVFNLHNADANDRIKAFVNNFYKV